MFFVVVLAIITSVFVAIQDPIIQKFAVRFAGGYLSEKTGADIKVGRLAVTPDFRIYIDDVVVKDLRKNDLAKIEKLRTKIDIGDLLGGKIHLDNVELRDTEANLIQYEGEDKFNFAFLAEVFKSDKEKPETAPMPIIVDKISLKHVDFVYWNQNIDHPEKTEQNLMDYSHIDLDDINLEATKFFMLGDSIHANIASLSAKELSGLELKHFSSETVVCSKGIYLDGMRMETNNSLFDMDLHMLYDDFTAFDDFVNKVNFDATIRPTDIMLSDIGVFTSVMYKMPDRVKFEGLFTGPIEHFSVDDFFAEFGKSTKIQGNLSMHPLDFENGEHTMNIKNMHFTYDDLVNFYIPSSTKTIPLPESLRVMNQGRVSLKFKGSYNNFHSEIMLNSGVGKIDANIARSNRSSGDNVFSGFVVGDGMNVGSFINNSKLLGMLDLNADFSMKFPKKGKPELDVKGNVHNAEILGCKIAEVNLDGSMKENRFKGKVKVDDDDLFLDFNGLVDFENKKFPKSDFNAVIRNANLNALHILKEDSISEISTKVYVNMIGFDLDDLEGEVRLDSTLYRDSRGTYFMKDFYASLVNDNLMQRRININCDFLDFEMAGQINFASLMMTFNEYADSFVHFPIWEDNRETFEKYKQTHDVDQDFIVQLNLKDTKTISRLLMPSVNIAKNTTLNGTFTSRTNTLNMTLRSKNVQVGQLNFNDIELRNFNFANSAFSSLKLAEIKYKNISESDTLELGFENVAINTRMTDDTIFARITWDDDEEENHNTGNISTYFHPHVNGGIYSITQADILVNDSLWNVSSNNFIDMDGDRVSISNLMFGHHNQSIRVDGYVPMNEGDTLSLQLRRFDISNLDFLFKGFDIDGFVSGDALVSSLKTNPMVFANLNVEKLKVDGEDVGEAVIESSWNNEKKSVDMQVNITDQEKRMLNAYGSYYTTREEDNLDFTVALDSLRLVTFSPLLTGIVSRMQGYADGIVRVTGSLKQPDIKGSVILVDAGCHIDYLNTFYTLSPTILIDNNSISFKNLILTDTLNNTAIVEGQINHNRFKDFELDLKLHPRDFLALATTSKENDTFYGTAIANGLITVKGPFNDIHLDIKAVTRKGTSLTIPLNRASTVKENDFIVFINPAEEEVEEEIPVESNEKKDSNFALDLDVTATNDATLKIILPASLGTIEAAGNGNVKLGTATKEELTMFGKYTIEFGRFALNFKDVVNRNFNLMPGGTISWTGSPTDGRINATGVYSIKGSLADLGAQVDTTMSVNTNVNVECLIHLKDALLNPTISFGMRLPNASEDITHTVFSLIDTTNQAVMTQQVLSLLVLSKFAYAGNSSVGGQTIDISGLFSTHMQVDITNKLNLGVSYHSGTVESYDEYQVALRTQLFKDRLTIETNLGVMTSNSGSSASNIVGEFDMYYKLSEDGRLQGHFYNHSNYNSNFNSFAIDRRAPYTQGLGLSYSRSFDKFSDLLKRKSKTSSNQPLIVPKKKENETDNHGK